MSEKFHNKYRISSARLQNWDYGSNAAYFITICTQNREHFFGEIENGKMKLSVIGNLVESEWLKTPEIRQDMNLQLDVFVVMPNHFHGILIIGENKYNIKNGTERWTQCRDAMHGVSADDQPSDVTHDTTNHFGPQSKNLASIIRGFKSAVTTNARKIHADFAWQPRYHDHIIRNNESFQKIKNYICENPLKWGNDKFYS